MMTKLGVRLLMASALALATPIEAAPLLGTVVTGTVTPGNSTTVSSQFKSPATVSNGVEFDGVFTDTTFQQVFQASADFDNNSLVVRFGSNRTFANYRSADGITTLLKLEFGSPSAFFSPIISSTHTCDASTFTFCSSNITYLPTVTESVSSLELAFSSVFAGDIYTFEFNPAATAVPEPGTWALMIMGFGMVGFAMRRRQQVRVSYAA